MSIKSVTNIPSFSFCRHGKDEEVRSKRPRHVQGNQTKWNNRLLVSTLSSTMVDAFKAWEHHFPPATDAEEEADLQSRLKEFVWRVIDEVCPTSLETHPTQIDSCRLELIGTRITSTGKQEGMKSTIQERCTECKKHGRTERNSNRKIRTSYRCAVHRDVYLCNANKGPCLAAHMEEHGCMQRPPHIS